MAHPPLIAVTDRPFETIRQLCLDRKGLCVSSHAGNSVLHVQASAACEASAAGQLHVALLVSRCLARNCTAADSGGHVSEMYVNTMALRSLCRSNSGISIVACERKINVACE